MADSHEIKRVFTSVGKSIIPGIFKDKTEFDKARSILLVKYERNKYHEKDYQDPISFKYFRDNFIFLCNHYPELVGTVMALGIDEPKLWLPDLRVQHTSVPLYWEDLSIVTIANAEYLFRDARVRVRDLLSNPSPSNQICNKVIDQIKPLAGAESYHDIRRIYWMLYCELRVTLQFHKQDPNWNFFFNISEHPEHWFQLRGENDVCVLKYLNEHSLDMYLNNPEEFRNGVLEAAKGDYVSEPEEKTIIKESFSANDKKLFEEFKEKHQFVAHSHAMLKVFKQIKKAAKTKISVIITGESGTGKELVAKAIHDKSNRKNEPFISRHCGSIPKGFIDATLFGCIADYIPGVPNGKDGIFTVADGGTIFLDEFADLPSEIQDKLLRVLEYGKITVVGKQTEDDVNVRVIVATNKNLKRLIRDGVFREDLYFRVNNYPITLPPVSERKNDIPQIAPILFTSCLKDTLELNDREIQKLIQPFMEDPKTYEILKRKNWENNVRSIKNHLEKVITEINEDLPSIKLSDFKKVLNDTSFNFKQQKDSNIKDNIFRGRKYEDALNAYIENGYVWKYAAEKLGINRQTEKTLVQIAVLRLAHHVNFELNKIPDILNGYGIIIQDEETDDFIKNINGILVTIIKQTIEKKARKAYKSEDKKLYMALVETRPDLVEIAKNK